MLVTKFKFLQLHAHQIEYLLIFHQSGCENDDTTTEVEVGLYGDIMEDLESTTIENPYYGDSFETSDNVYYDLDDMEFSGPRATIVTATQNVYYE